jgi:hypothetical protein
MDAIKQTTMGTRSGIKVRFLKYYPDTINMAIFDNFNAQG